MQERMLNAVSVTLHITWIVGCRAVKRMALVAALVALCVFSGGLAHAGTVYSWTKTMGGESGDYGRSAAVDGSGNVYVTGYFFGTADFDPGPDTDDHTSVGGNDIFLTKINPDGTYGWTKTMGGTNVVYGHSATVDGSGNVYVTGRFEGTADFDPGPDTDDHTSVDGSADIFLTKINPDGTYGWTKTMGGSMGDWGNSAAVDGSGNVYVAGYFVGTADFDPGPGDNHTSTGSNDIFVTKINSDGTYGWTKTMGGETDDQGYSARVDGSGNVYVAGYFVGTADFDPGPDTDNHTSRSYDIFLTKINADGTYGWTKTMGGIDNDYGISPTVDGSGNVYVAGSFQRTADFDPGPDTDDHTSVGGNDIFLTKINPDGTYGWTKTMGGAGNDSGHSAAVDGSGNVYVAGYFQGTADFDPGPDTDDHTSVDGSADIFLTKFTMESPAGGDGDGGGCFIATVGSGVD
ncbi:MAG TPA: hypothetical protein VMW89_09575 [Desulfatiglandales bacterium]|nr:hypothetical protein [Desulfatiglandales bacterium]